jgi:hypothetical protein
MSELIKDFEKFVMEVILFLIVLVTIFSDQGIAVNTFQYLTFVEPILLQNWLSTALTIGSSAPGEFITTTKTTGQPFTIKIFNEDGVMYVLVEPPSEFYIRAKFATIEKTPLISNCSIAEQEIKLKKNLIQSIVVKKTLNENGCSMIISVPAETVIVGPYIFPPVTNPVPVIRIP